MIKYALGYKDFNLHENYSYITETTFDQLLNGGERNVKDIWNKIKKQREILRIM